MEVRGTPFKSFPSSGFWHSVEKPQGCSKLHWLLSALYGAIVLPEDCWSAGEFYDPKPGSHLSQHSVCLTLPELCKANRTGGQDLAQYVFTAAASWREWRQVPWRKKISSVALLSQIAFRKRKHLNHSKEITGIAPLYLPLCNTMSLRETQATCILCQNLFPQHVDKSGRISYLSEV